MKHTPSDSDRLTMTLYLLTRKDDVDYGEAEAQAIIAADTDEARRLAMRDLSKQQQVSWLDPQRSSCIPITSVATDYARHVLTAYAPD